MQRRLSATPCPAAGSMQYRPRDSIISVEDTTQIEFTTVLRRSLLDVKPRRRQTAVRSSRASTVHFTIHEDEDAVHHSGKECQPHRSSQSGFALNASLSRPPQRLGRRVSFAPDDQAIAYDVAAPTSKPRQPQAPQRALQKMESVPEAVATAEEPFKDSVKMSKPARRGTIYIPSDDTTMPSLYMGIFSPVNLPANSTNISATTELTGIAAQMAKKRGPRKSMVAERPRRGPLQTSLRVAQESAMVQDIPGLTSGKENIPPRSQVRQDHSMEKDLFDLRPSRPRHRYSLSADNARRKSVAAVVRPASTVAEFPRSQNSSDAKSCSVSGHQTKKPVWNSGVQVTQIRPLPVWKQSQASALQPEPQAPLNTIKVPSKFVVPRISAEQPLTQHLLLTEDIANPEMYEEDWLTHQEVAIAQLVNSLFSASRNTDAGLDSTRLRIELLETYRHPSFSLIHKRLQASLLYGALSMPKETLAMEASRLSKDLGLKSSFIKLWLHTFELKALRPALEVVVGRQCESSTEAVREFLDIFLIKNIDGQPENGQSRPAWSYTRTFLRSLMVVRLLDQVKTQTEALPGCLFQPTSEHKSSAAFLRALTRLLNPSIGDVLRALSHVDYHVQHNQYPLEEYEYPILNLAVDVRDGVRLTRLVELLLYPSSSPQLAHYHDGDATTTILMPTGEILSLINGQQEWPLSQHLKFPCLGHATKMYNIQIALGALQGVSSMKPLLQDIGAADIVLGHREKTVALLWALAGKWGLAGLIDWHDVRWEIKNLDRRRGKWDDWNEDRDSFDLAQCEPGFETYKALLKRWAGAVAATKGLHVSNLTTSFADGKVFGAIVDEYQRYLISDTEQFRRLALHERLLRLGCSSQFAQLFAPTASSQLPGRIFDRDCTLASLAFLCSRLLSATKRTRAAIVIQRAWRHRWGKGEAATHVSMNRLAKDHTPVICKTPRLLWAKETIWRAWERHRLDRGTEAFYSQKREESELDVWLTL